MDSPVCVRLHWIKAVPVFSRIHELNGHASADRAQVMTRVQMCLRAAQVLFASFDFGQ